MEGKTNFEVYNPSRPEKTITDIDKISGNTLWEEKSAVFEGNVDLWVERQITQKFDKYIEARKYIPGYENAEIGFHMTTPNVNADLKNAIQVEINRLQKVNPEVIVKLKFE